MIKLTSKAVFYISYQDSTVIHHKLTLLFQNGQKMPIFIKNFTSIFSGQFSQCAVFRELRCFTLGATGLLWIHNRFWNDLIRRQIHKMSFFALAFLWRKSSWLFESWIFSSMLFRKVWLVDQSVHFHFQFLKGQSSFAPWRLHCQAKVKVKTKRGEKMNSSRWNTTQILEFFFLQL